MYDYATERPKIFTEAGAEMLEAIRRNVRRAINLAGAVRVQEAMRGVMGDSWEQLACIDYLAERGEIKVVDRCEVTQYQVYVAGHNYWTTP
jgi:hypothetical protein